VTAQQLVTRAPVGRYGRVDAAIERELVSRLRGGDAAAFDEIYAWMRPRVFSFLARMTGRRDVADDLSQEVWLRLARNAAKLAPDTRLAAWLFTVARNLYVSHWRAHQVAAQLAGGLLPLPPTPPSPFETAAETQISARIERAMTALPETYREILLLCAVEGMTPKDAAVVLGISGEAARQRLARARTMIDRALGEPARYPGGTP
jgi:RNA polymerase sigma-70 factor (ECF subfamily)